ncbi:MAG: aminoacyl-tRNA hydrolase [Anaerolineales bacterium]
MNESVEKKTFLIVGLGNPGRQFRYDRHNIGFMALNKLSEKYGEAFSRVQFDALLTDVRINNDKVFLSKPQTFMNNSGTPVAQLMRYYRIPIENLLVVFDDLDLPLGYLRLRPQGGSGGHRGVQSIIDRIGSQDFPRMRLGIGRPPGIMDPSAFVLQSFSEEEGLIVEILLNRAAECIETFHSEGIDSAMNRFNVKDNG